MRKSTRETRYWVGFDDDARKIEVAIFRDREDELLERFVVQRDSRGLKKLSEKLQALKGRVRCVYEAGPCGYGLQRMLSGQGIECAVAAPSHTPRPPARRRVKTNRIDARELARMYRGGTLTLITLPSVEQESLRDLLRAREDVQGEVLRCRHRLSKLLLRHGYVYTEGTKWTRRHLKWIDAIELVGHSQIVLLEAKAALGAALEQLQRMDAYVNEAATDPRVARQVQLLSALRGIQAISALTILSELGDLRRFARAGGLMSAVGVVPSEFSTGSERRQGSITKVGNAHVRRVLLEAAWHYRHRPPSGGKVAARRAKLDPQIVAIAHKADLRLYRKYSRLVARGKRTTLAAVATARELIGFIWAIGQHL